MKMIEFLINLCECSLFVWLVSEMMTSRVSLKARCGGLIATTVYLSCLNYMNIDTTVQITLIWLVRVIYSLWAFENSRFERILWPCIFMVILSLAERVAFKIASLIGLEDLKVVLIPGLERYMIIIVYLFVVAVLVFSTTRINYVRIELPLVYQLLLLGFIYCCLVCADTLSDHMIETHQLGLISIRNFSDVVFLMLASMVIIFMIMLKKVAQIYSEKNQLILEQQHTELVKREFEINRQTQEMLSAWRHDYQNHINIVYSLLKKGDLDRARIYIEKMNYSNQEEEQSINCGEVILDVILSAKINRAKTSGIRFEHEVLLTNPLPLEENDLTTLLGNLLDNAIEANLKVAEEKRFIEFRMKSIKDDYYILIKNRFNKQLTIKGKNLVSDKAKYGHGIGVKQAKKVLDRVGGFLEWESQDDIFVLKVIIPTKKEV